MGSNTESVLDVIKQMLGLPEDVTSFDTDLIININSIFMTLQQLGVGPEEGFSISKVDNTTWPDFLGDKKDLEAVKTYIYLKTRLLFDPPSSAFVLDAMERQIKELEWRLRLQAEKKEA